MDKILADEYLIFPVPKKAKTCNFVGKSSVAYIGPLASPKDWEFSSAPVDPHERFRENMDRDADSCPATGDLKRCIKCTI
jgi:hypothetical protein